eukprot:3949778-Pyramimonas_sp.AAC.1
MERLGIYDDHKKPLETSMNFVDMRVNNIGIIETNYDMITMLTSDFEAACPSAELFAKLVREAVKFNVPLLLDPENLSADDANVDLSVPRVFIDRNM